MAAEIIRLFGNDPEKEARARRDCARFAAARPALIRPFAAAAAPLLDTRFCAALPVDGHYLVLQFDEDAEEGALEFDTPVADAWHISNDDFAARYAPLHSLPLHGALRDLFHRHIFSCSPDTDGQALACAQKIAAVYEVTRSGVWQPDWLAEEYMVDESGRHAIDRSAVLLQGDLILRYQAGNYAAGPAPQMRRRLALLP
jgi:hypothetical protein